MVSSKSVVPPEGTNILDVVAGSICRAAYAGQFYRAKVVALGELKLLWGSLLQNTHIIGTNSEMKKKQKEIMNTDVSDVYLN